MSKLIKTIFSFIVGGIVLIAKADISSASSVLFYQPKLPKEKNEKQNF